LRVYYHPTVGDYARYDSFELDHAALAGVPSGIAAGIAGWAFKRASWEALLASLGGGCLMAGAFGAFYPKRVLSWFNPPPFDAPIVYPRQIPKAVAPSFIGESGQVLNLLMHEGSGSVAKDYSPYRNHATIRGASWVDGSFGWALSLNGVNNYLVVAGSASLNPTSEFTVLGWIKPLALDHVAQFIQRNNLWQDTYIRTDGSLGWGMFTGGVYYVYSAPANTLKVGEWTHVALRYSHANADRYVWHANGVEVAEGATAGRPDDASGDLFIGSFQGASNYFNGLFALPCIYNTDKGADFIKRVFEGQRVLFGV
jgi:hypothetical protein